MSPGLGIATRPPLNTTAQTPRGCPILMGPLLKMPPTLMTGDLDMDSKKPLKGLCLSFISLSKLPSTSISNEEILVEGRLT
jgi:hypothetical protein